MSKANYCPYCGKKAILPLYKGASKYRCGNCGGGFIARLHYEVSPNEEVVTSFVDIGAARIAIEREGDNMISMMGDIQKIALALQNDIDRANIIDGIMRDDEEGIEYKIDI